MTKLSKEEEKELQKLADEINQEAKNVVEDYINNPSTMSGSFHQIHENSPLINKKKLVKKKKD